MQSTTKLGLLIAGLIAAAFLAYSFFGTRHESWFVRAAQDNAVRCLTKSSCTRLMPGGGLMSNARPPLGEASVCARREGWRQLRNLSNGQTSIVLTCTDGTAYLYHMGALSDRQGGAEQWMQCSDSACESEASTILKSVSARAFPAAR